MAVTSARSSAPDTTSETFTKASPHMIRVSRAARSVRWWMSTRGSGARFTGPNRVGVTRITMATTKTMLSTQSSVKELISISPPAISSRLRRRRAHSATSSERLCTRWYISPTTITAAP